MTAVAAKTDRSDLCLFKESISAAGVLTLVDTLWFTGDADRELPIPPGGAGSAKPAPTCPSRTSEVASTGDQVPLWPGAVYSEGHD